MIATIIILLFTTLFPINLHAMENNDQSKELIFKAHKYLKGTYYHQDNVDKYSKLIHAADETGAKRLMARLIHICLPPEVVQTYINPHLSKSVIIKYKHQLIASKCLTASFTTKPIYNNNQWDHLIQHDGTYHIVPKIKDEYIMWDNTHVKRRHTFTFKDDNNTYATERAFTKNKNAVRCTLSIPSSYDNQEEQNKIIMLAKHKKNNCSILTPISSKSNITHYLFSNDCSLVAIGTDKEKENISLYNVALSCFEYASLNGPISVLCSAHNSPMFAAGSSDAFFYDFPNIALIRWGKNDLPLGGHNAPITHLQFSPDDTKLLTCSYNKTNDISLLLVWDIINFKCIYGVESKSPLNKALFIGNGERIITIGRNGKAYFFNSLTGEQINKVGHCWHNSFNDTNRQDAPLLLCNNQDKLLISTLDDRIRFLKCTSGAYIGSMSTNTITIGLGLRTNKKTITLMNKSEAISHLKLYDKKDRNEIKFIKEEANIMQLYKMLSIYKQNKFSDKETHDDKIKSFILSIQSYIQKHQKKSKNT